MNVLECFAECVCAREGVCTRQERQELKTECVRVTLCVRRSEKMATKTKAETVEGE